MFERHLLLRLVLDQVIYSILEKVRSRVDASLRQNGSLMKLARGNILGAFRGSFRVATDWRPLDAGNVDAALGATY